MANIKQAIDFVLRSEDRNMSGHVTNVKHDRGGRTRFGVAEASHPELNITGFYDEDRMPRDKALAVAEHVYEQAYAKPCCVADIADQCLATAVLSFAINAGVHPAALALQNAIEALGIHVIAAGKIGPSTLTAVSQLNPQTLLAEFSAQARAHYAELIAEKPEQVKFKNGWNNRVDEWKQAA